MSRLGSTAAVAALCVLCASCRAAVPPWGATPEAARRNADNAFAAFAFRFHNVQRDPKFAHARPLLGRYALIPSKVFNDTSVWSIAEQQDATRALILQASHTGAGYSFVTRTAAPLPARVGDERHYMQLKSLGEDSYEWYTTVEHGIGPVRAPQVADAIGALFTAFDGKRDVELLADARASFSRTGQHLGQLFALDSLRSTPLADGTTTFAMFGGYRLPTLRRAYPDFAAYVQKYVSSSDFHIELADRSGAKYLDFRQGDADWIVKLRASNGSLVPLTGAPRPMPDSLLLLMDASAKLGIFRVGFTKLVGDFTIERSDGQAAWMMRWRKEPNWHFPLAVDKLIKSPLRRPFEGRGTELRLAVRDDIGAQAMSERTARTVVRESAIMRWLGGLGATAFGDFEGRTEMEENRFLQELFGALRQDVAAWRP